MEKIQIWKKLKSHKLPTIRSQSFPQYPTNQHSNYIGFPQPVYFGASLDSTFNIFLSFTYKKIDHLVSCLKRYFFKCNKFGFVIENRLPSTELVS